GIPPLRNVREGSPHHRRRNIGGFHDMANVETIRRSTEYLRLRRRRPGEGDHDRENLFAHLFVLPSSDAAWLPWSAFRARLPRRASRPTLSVPYMARCHIGPL